MKIRFLLPCFALLSLMFLVGCPPTPEQPTAPEPVMLEPIPEPVTPEPVTPEPVTPEPVTPEPVTPEPVTPEPVTPEPVTPEPPAPPAAPVPPAVVMPAETPEETAVRERVVALGGSIRKNAEGRIDRVIIGNTSNLTLADAQAIGKLTSIAWIRLVGPTITDEYVEALSGLTNLKIVDFENSNITDRSLEILKACPEIHTLDLRRNLGLTDNAIKLFAEFPKLQTLNILYNGFTESSLYDLDQLQSVRILDLRALPVTDGVLMFIADMENLEEIYIRSNSVTNAGIAELVNCPKLRAIELQDSSIGVGSGAIFAEMKSLRFLRIFRGGQFGAEAVAELGVLTDLERLELRELGCSNEALLALKPLTQLKIVEFSELPNVDAATVIDVLKSYPKLESISIFSIPADDTVASFLATVPTLRSITLRETAITDAGLDALTALADLTFLDIRGNQERLTAQGMLVLGKFKNLQRLIFPATLDNPALRSAILENSPRCVFSPL